MLGQKDFQQENLTLTEQNENQKQTHNHFLDEYNGKPTLETIRQLIIQKQANGDISRKIWVDVGWALEKEEFFINQTNFTWSSVQNAPHQLYQYEQRMLEAQQKANLEHRKSQDLLVENTLVYERLNQMTQEIKDKEATLAQALSESRIIKLPVSKVRTFLALSSNETEDFYIKIDDNGNMQRIVSKPEEL